jgi:hypothetical protein
VTEKYSYRYQSPKVIDYPPRGLGPRRKLPLGERLAVRARRGTSLNDVQTASIIGCLALTSILDCQSSGANLLSRCSQRRFGR